MDPLLAGVAHHERAEGEGEGDGEADVAEVEHRRVDDHLRVLEEWVEAEAVGGELAGLDGEGWGGEVEQEEEEDLCAGQDGGGEGREANVDLMADAEDEAVGGEQPGPEQERALLAGPEGGELVGRVEFAVGVVEDVGERVVVGEGGPDEGEGGAGDGDEAGDAGATSGLLEAGADDLSRRSRGARCVSAKGQVRRRQRYRRRASGQAAGRSCRTRAWGAGSWARNHRPLPYSRRQAGARPEFWAVLSTQMNDYRFAFASQLSFDQMRRWTLAKR